MQHHPFRMCFRTVMTDDLGSHCSTLSMPHAAVHWLSGFACAIRLLPAESGKLLLGSMSGRNSPTKSVSQMGFPSTQSVQANLFSPPPGGGECMWSDAPTSRLPQRVVKCFLSKERRFYTYV